MCDNLLSVLIEVRGKEKERILTESQWNERVQTDSFFQGFMATSMYLNGSQLNQIIFSGVCESKVLTGVSMANKAA